MKTSDLVFLAVFQFLLNYLHSHYFILQATAMSILNETCNINIVWSTSCLTKANNRWLR